MITFQKAAVMAALATLLGIAIYEGRRASALESELQELQAQGAVHADPTEQQAREPVEGAEGIRGGSDAGTAELLRLRGEVSMLQRQLNDARAVPSPASNHIVFTEPYMPREAWSDRGTDKPLSTLLTMFWAVREGDESKLERMVSRVRDTQTLDEMIYPKSDWGNITAVQVVGIGKAVPVIDGKPQEIAMADVIVEESPPDLGGSKALSMQCWSLRKVNDQWLITGYR